MNTNDEKLLLLKAIGTVRDQLESADSTDMAIDAAERLRTLNQCLIELNWAELNRRKII